MGAIIEFLEKSTIHGLSFIRDAKSLGEKAFWVIIVTLGFGFAASLIGNSYSQWMKSPVSTVVTTKPISELEFPEVTVCPPRGSNTALNHVLKKMEDEKVNTWTLREHLLGEIHKIYAGQPMTFAKNMAHIMNIRTLHDVKTGKILIPERSENIIHYQLNISTMENLVVQAEKGQSWTYSWQEEQLKLYRDQSQISFAKAEAFCVSLGGHLASVQSEKENAEVLKIAKQQQEWAWLGGTDEVKEGKWVWSDGQAWNFTDWAVGEPNNKSDSRCIGTLGDDWFARSCLDGQIFPMCRVEPRTTNGTLQIDLSEKQMTKFHIWIKYNSSDPHYFEDSSLRINISWEDTAQQGEVKKQKSMRVDSQRLELQHFIKKVSWQEAEELCQQKGGHLASIASNEEQEELVNLVGNRFFWLGGSDAQKEGQWTWNDGTPWKMDYWNQSEPNGRGGENCLAILKEAWTDRDCENKNTLHWMGSFAGYQQLQPISGTWHSFSQKASCAI